MRMMIAKAMIAKAMMMMMKVAKMYPSQGKLLMFLTREQKERRLKAVMMKLKTKMEIKRSLLATWLLACQKTPCMICLPNTERLLM
jgi:hypothetical protein